MARWKLWFVLLLLRTCCTDCKAAGERLVKTIGKEPDVTPVCPNETLQSITVVICTISTERSREEECQLFYQYGHDFEHGCDSRFSLIKENQTVFLHLSNLTQDDSGNYSCQCSYSGGTDTLHLSVTVEGDEDVTIITTSPTETPFSFIVTGVITFVIIIGLILGFICRKMGHSWETSSVLKTTSEESIRISPSYNNKQNTPGAARPETLQSLDQGDTYTRLQRPDSDVYQSVSVSHPYHNTGFRSACAETAIAYTNSQKADGKEHDFNSFYCVYETI